MRLVFKKDKITYENLVKLLLVGHAVGMIAITLPIMVISLAVALMSESADFPPNMLLAPIMLPLILIAQAFILALIYRAGFWLYQLFRPIQIEISE